MRKECNAWPTECYLILMSLQQEREPFYTLDCYLGEKRRREGVKNSADNNLTSIRKTYCLVINRIIFSE